MNIIDEARMERYLATTKEALAKVHVAAAAGSWAARVAGDYMDMAQRYYDDACHFASKGEAVTAFACVNYAHGWLDAGARLGVFDVGGDTRLFTLLG